jgi:DNA-binding Lrp family transcriptional regulator
MVDSDRDGLDVAILHALQIDGRASFSLIGDVLGVSGHTVARRYNRLRAAGRLRVRGLGEPSKTGHTQWIVRIRCTPSTAAPLADALARRSDTSWISLTAGGSEIVCVVDAPTGGDHLEPLLAKLPLSRSVLALEAHCVLHEFFGGPMSFINKNGPLRPDQVAALTPALARTSARNEAVLTADEPLLRALRHDGRATVTRLASSTGWSQSTVRRRIVDLVSTGRLYFDVDFDQGLFDLRMRAAIWLRVPTEQLAVTGQSLAEHPEVGYAAATTGVTNLYCAVSCPTADALYGYLTERLAQLTCIQHLETAPIMRSVKSSSILDGP